MSELRVIVGEQMCHVTIVGVYAICVTDAAVWRTLNKYWRWPFNNCLATRSMWLLSTATNSLDRAMRWKSFSIKVLWVIGDYFLYSLTGHTLLTLLDTPRSEARHRLRHVRPSVRPLHSTVTPVRFKISNYASCHAIKRCSPVHWHQISLFRIALLRVDTENFTIEIRHILETVQDRKRVTILHT